MNTKLTLTIERTVIERAKNYAKNKDRSLSDLVENYLKIITSEEAETKDKITPLVNSLKGSFTAPPEFNYKKELSKRLSEKYLTHDQGSD